MDAAISGTQMMNMATELGLGTLWARGFDSKKVHDAFDLPANIRVLTDSVAFTKFINSVCSNLPSTNALTRRTGSSSAIDYSMSEHYPPLTRVEMIPDFCYN